MKDTKAYPLLVDIDGTLLRGDLFLEGTLKLISKNPLMLFYIVFKLITTGRAWVKAYVAGASGMEIGSLPFSEGTLDLIKSQRQKGAPIVLASGSNERLANEIGSYLGADSVLASTESRNLTGRNKLAEARRIYGEFDYAGNSLVDMPLWKGARQAYVVNAGAVTRFFAKLTRPDALIIEDDTPAAKLQKIMKLFRVHHWSKNILLFAALIVSHKLITLKGVDLIRLFLGFMSFSLLASSVYIVNDIFDVEHDRKHSKKKNRPIASGSVSIRQSLLLLGATFLVSAIIAESLPDRFVLILAAYFILSLSYTFYLKRLVIIDVITLSMLYTLRVVAGAELIFVSVSKWFLAFTVFTFFSLSLLKRCADILHEKHGSKVFGRGYRADDYTMLACIGACSSVVAVLIYCFYISANEITRYYSRPEVLWLGLPILLYFFTRLWLLANRGEIHSDPVSFVIKDMPSYFVVCALMLVVYFAI